MHIVNTEHLSKLCTHSNSLFSLFDKTMITNKKEMMSDKINSIQYNTIEIFEYFDKICFRIFTVKVDISYVVVYCLCLLYLTLSVTEYLIIFDFNVFASRNVFLFVATISFHFSFCCCECAHVSSF